MVRTAHPATVRYINQSFLNALSVITADVKIRLHSGKQRLDSEYTLRTTRND